MNDLASRLKNIGEAGVYNITCDLNELRKAASVVNFSVFDADLNNVHSKGEFLAAVAQAIAAPAWLGKNWDALADALGDMSWQTAQGYVLVLRNGGETFNLSASDHAIAREIMQETVNFWKRQAKPCWIFYC